LYKSPCSFNVRRRRPYCPLSSSPLPLQAAHCPVDLYTAVTPPTVTELSSAPRHSTVTVAALHQGAPGQITWLEDAPPWLPPCLLLCFASVIV